MTPGLGRSPLGGAGMYPDGRRQERHPSGKTFGNNLGAEPDGAEFRARQSENPADPDENYFFSARDPTNIRRSNPDRAWGSSPNVSLTFARGHTLPSGPGSVPRLSRLTE